MPSGCAAGVVRPLGRRPARRPGSAGADVHLVRGTASASVPAGASSTAGTRRRRHRAATSAPTVARGAGRRPDRDLPPAGRGRRSRRRGDVHLGAARPRPGAGRPSEPHLPGDARRARRALLRRAPRRRADDDETWVNDGYLAASHRRSHTDPEPVAVGEADEYRVADPPPSPPVPRRPPRASARERRRRRRS